MLNVAPSYVETSSLRKLIDETFREFLDDEFVENINVNQPYEIWVEFAGGERKSYKIPKLSLDRIERMAIEIAAAQNIEFCQSSPISTKLSDGSRIEILLSDSVPSGVCMAIRKRRATSFSITDFGFNSTQANDIINAVKAKKTILVSGSTSSGKTSLIDAMQQQIEATRRIVTIQDPIEIDFAVKNKSEFTVTKTIREEKEKELSIIQTSAMRINPDSIIIGEIREKYMAYAFYQMINTGHDGSMTTIHSNEGVKNAVERLANLVLEYTQGDFQRTKNALYENIDLFIHVQKHKDGRYGKIQTK